MNNNDVQGDLHLDLLINSKKKTLKDSKHKTSEHSIKLNKLFNKYDNLILKNEIVLSNFDEFILYLDESIKNNIYSFCKKKTHKID